MKPILRFAVVAALFVLLAAEPTRLTEAAPVHINNATVVATESSEQTPSNSGQTEKPVKQVKPAPTPVPKPQSTNTSESEAKMFIYMKESGNRLDAVNSIGCIGLGQDCNGVLAKECPNWRTDRVCQDTFWEKYMQRRYGTWQAAKAFWIARVPINGKNVGHWW
jgi:hypothetical protein